LIVQCAIAEIENERVAAATKIQDAQRRLMERRRAKVHTDPCCQPLKQFLLFISRSSPKAARPAIERNSEALESEVNRFFKGLEPPPPKVHTYMEACCQFLT